MNYFWGNVFEYFKDRRGPAVFFISLLVLLVLLFIGAAILQGIGAENLWTGFKYSLPVTGVVLAIWIWRSVRRARARSRDRYKISPLSRDEMRKARSKLMRAK
jgi:Na+-driven multidrug efflux pump